LFDGELSFIEGFAPLAENPARLVLQPVDLEATACALASSQSFPIAAAWCSFPSCDLQACGTVGPQQTVVSEFGKACWPAANAEVCGSGRFAEDLRFRTPACTEAGLKTGGYVLCRYVLLFLRP
jgi:hypothetical protein